jgi:hypothetical protein
MSNLVLSESFVNVHVDGLHSYVSQETYYHMVVNLQAKGYDLEVISSLGLEDSAYFTSPVLEDTILEENQDSKKFLVIKKIGDRVEAYLEGSLFLAWSDEISAMVGLLPIQANGYTAYWI